MRWHLSLLLLAVLPGWLAAQPVMDYAYPREYEIGGITVTGCVTRDANAVKLFTDLKVGDKITIPGEKIGRAIHSIWDQKLFSDVRIEAAEIRGSTIFLNIIVQENPQVATFAVRDVSKSDEEKLVEQLRTVGVARGRQVDEALLENARFAIRRFYVDKGYLKVKTRVEQTAVDSAHRESAAYLENSVSLVFHVDRGPRIRIKDVEFYGNESLSDDQLRRAMKNTRRKRWWNIFGTSKFNAKEFRADLNSVVDLYNEHGYRNAAVVRDTMYYVGDDKLRVEVTVDEDHKFYYRNVSFSGNTKHIDAELADILNIKRGDVYNKKVLDSRLYMNQSGRDVSSLYMDDGYLAFNPDPVEIVDGDSIDLEIRIREGRQYRVRDVIIKGNTKTSEHVIRREIYTRPGDLFNRSDVLRTQRELANLGFFDPEKLGVNPIQDARTGQVDLEYTVEEKPSDRLELSGGYGGGRLVLSVGVSFTNFAARKVFQKGAWQPLPSGDGQTLNFRIQFSGPQYRNISLSFVEPWLGGRKPNALSTSVYYSQQTNGLANENPLRQELNILGASIGLGKRLTWPDDYFIMRHTLSYQLYDLHNYFSLFSFNNGTSNVIAYQLQLSRNSVDQPFYPRSGSEVMFSVKLTPPWSKMRGLIDVYPDTEPETWTDAERYHFAEFKKFKFTTKWYTRVTRSKSGHDLVLMARAGFGLLTYYSDFIGDSPFERFYLGGSGLTGFSLDGREIIALRGYDDGSLSSLTGDFFISKYTTELRFPISLNPSATIYTLAFLEAGRSWNNIDRFDPFNLYRAAGFGLRLFLPMFGPMGLDYGWRLDDVPNKPFMAKSQFHFTIGIDLGEL